MEPWKDRIVEGERHQCSLVIRIKKGCEGRGHVVANCMIKHCLPLKTFIPNFVAFFVLLGIALSCIWKIFSSVTTTKWEFTVAIVLCRKLSILGGRHCPLARDSEPIRFLEITMSLSLITIFTKCTRLQF